MRILAIESVGSWGGAQCSFFENCMNLSRMGTAFTILPAVPEGPLAEHLRLAGLNPYPIPTFQPQKEISSLLSFVRTQRELRQVIRKAAPDLLYANSFSSWLPLSVLRSDLPKIWHHRDLRIPRFFLHRGLQQANHVIAASKRIRSELLSAADGRTLGKIHLIPNGIDTSRFVPSDQREARCRWHLPESGTLIGMAAHLVPWKNHSLFLEAANAIAERIPDAHFVLLGRDITGKQETYRTALHAYAQSLTIREKLHWLEIEDATETLYPALDLLIHPPIDEPFGRVVCEAMACGVPVLASTPGGPDEIITSGENGQLLPHPDAERIAEAAVDLLKALPKDPFIHKKAREAIVRSFDSRRVAGDLERLFNRFV